MKSIDDTDSRADLSSALQIVLAEKRTAMAMLRTGIAVLVIPMSVISFLVATSRWYDVFHVNYLIIPLLSVAGLLVLFSGYLIWRAVLQLHRYDHVLNQLKQQHPWLARLL